MIVQKGEVYLVQLSEDKIGSEQSGRRPCVIVQNNTGNRFSTTTIVAVLTTKDKKSKQGKHYPMQVPMEKTQLDDGELEEDSLLLCEQMFTVDKERLTKKIGRIFPTNPLYQEIDRAIGISLGLESEQ